jgi:CrcB protein
VTKLLLVAAGGALGALVRYLLGMWIAGRVGPDFPWGTFIINVSGSLLIGVVLGLVSEGYLSSELRLFVAVGILGGYTTFSTFSYETVELLADGNMRAFLFNALGQLVAGLVAVYFGLVASRILILLGGAR